MLKTHNEGGNEVVVDFRHNEMASAQFALLQKPLKKVFLRWPSD